MRASRCIRKPTTGIFWSAISTSRRHEHDVVAQAASEDRFAHADRMRESCSACKLTATGSTWRGSESRCPKKSIRGGAIAPPTGLRANKGRRLDHIWVSQALGNCVRDFRITSAARGWERPSDHVPVTAVAGCVSPISARLCTSLRVGRSDMPLGRPRRWCERRNRRAACALRGMAFEHAPESRLREMRSTKRLLKRDRRRRPRHRDHQRARSPIKSVLARNGFIVARFIRRRPTGMAPYWTYETGSSARDTPRFELISSLARRTNVSSP